MKRFYKKAAWHEEGPKAFGVTLDGRPIRTPLRGYLRTPTTALATAIAAEWNAQNQDIDPATMPLTQIMSTVIDRVAGDRESMTNIVMAYLDTDLTCYFAPRPPELTGLQHELWDPARSVFEARAGVRLSTTTELIALRQPGKARACAEKELRDMDDPMFCVAQMVTALTGSLVLALGCCRGSFDAAYLYDAATVEDAYKAKIYSEDIHGPAPEQKRYREALRRDLDAAAHFLSLLQKP